MLVLLDIMPLVHGLDRNVNTLKRRKHHLRCAALRLVVVPAYVGGRVIRVNYRTGYTWAVRARTRSRFDPWFGQAIAAGGRQRKKASRMLL